jgi:hypothetical protein
VPQRIRFVSFLGLNYVKLSLRVSYRYDGRNSLSTDLTVTLIKTLRRVLDFELKRKIGIDSCAARCYSQLGCTRTPLSHNQETPPASATSSSPPCDGALDAAVLVAPWRTPHSPPAHSDVAMPLLCLPRPTRLTWSSAA